MSRGDFAPLVGWLGEHVHRRASLRDTAGLITDATGGPLDAAIYQAHLRRRYLGSRVD
jgi:carboxypeptidase Taq